MIGNKESFKFMAKAARKVREFGTCAGNDQKLLSTIALNCSEARKITEAAEIKIAPLKNEIENCFKSLNRQAVIEVTRDFAARKSQATAQFAKEKGGKT